MLCCTISCNCKSLQIDRILAPCNSAGHKPSLVSRPAELLLNLHWTHWVIIPNNDQLRSIQMNAPLANDLPLHARLSQTTRPDGPFPASHLSAATQPGPRHPPMSPRLNPRVGCCLYALRRLLVLHQMQAARALVDIGYWKQDVLCWLIWSCIWDLKCNPSLLINPESSFWPGHSAMGAATLAKDCLRAVEIFSRCTKCEDGELKVHLSQNIFSTIHSKHVIKAH